MYRALLLLVLIACREPAEPPEAAPEAPAATKPAEEPAPEAPPAESPPAEPAPEAPPAEPAVGKADGASCLASSECASGVCEGEGCGDDHPGTCMSKMRACTRDARPYCGCDGVTFRQSGTCPGQRYDHRGACEP